MNVHGRRNRLLSANLDSNARQGLLGMPVAVLPRAEPELVPASRCSGCDKPFQSGQHCMVGSSGMGGHAAAITYCFDCRDAGWPCERFDMVIHP